MGKNITSYFNQEQQLFLDAFLAYPEITSSFYLTGGTALAACYFNHRFSEDIDLFSSSRFNETAIIELMKEIAEKLDVVPTFVKIEDRLTYDLMIKKKKLKVDFVYYPYKQLEQANYYKNLAVDSIEDIAVNKLLTITQRTNSKDFVDLYFLLEKYTVWDLRHGVAHKFKMDLEPFYLSSLLFKVKELTNMPTMKKKLTLEEVKQFFLEKATTLARTMVKE